MLHVFNYNIDVSNFSSPTSCFELSLNVFVYPTKLPLLVFRTIILFLFTLDCISINRCRRGTRFGPINVLLTISSDVVVLPILSHTQHGNLIGLSCSASDWTEAYSCVNYYSTGDMSVWWIFPKLILINPKSVLLRNCPVLLAMVFLTITSF